MRVRYNKMFRLLAGSEWRRYSGHSYRNSRADNRNGCRHRWFLVEEKTSASSFF